LKRSLPVKAVRSDADKLLELVYAAWRTAQRRGHPFAEQAVAFGGIFAAILAEMTPEQRDQALASHLISLTTLFGDAGLQQKIEAIIAGNIRRAAH
jgi:hypothetical protein